MGGGWHWICKIILPKTNELTRKPFFVCKVIVSSFKHLFFFVGAVFKGDVLVLIFNNKYSNMNLFYATLTSKNGPKKSSKKSLN